MQTSPSIETCPLPRRENFLALMRWEWLHEDARTVPLHLLAPAERELKINSFRARDERREELDRWLREELVPELKRYARRRQIEHAIADYLDRHERLPEKVEKLRTCRMHGDLGALREEEGGPRRIIMWHCKCGNNGLCPDEAREEQMRIAKSYPPKTKEWLEARHGRQAQYCVLTWPNVAPGTLDFFKREMFRQLVKFLQIEKGKNGVARSKRFPAICGVLATQEDPLSCIGDWNLHLNLLLLVDGYFPWAEFRAGWFEATRHLFDKKHRDFQVYFKNIKGKTLKDIVRAVLELVKYSAKHITEGHGHDDENDSGECLAPDAGDTGVARRAPGLVQWPIARFDEWYAARQRFRRTRSYGALFAVEEVEPEKLDQSKVQWIGKIDYDKAAGYVVTITDRGPINLIQDHNSRSAPDHKSGGRGSDPPK